MKNLMATAKLISDAGLAQEGRDLFINTLPADVSRGVMLRNPLGGIEIDDGMEGFFVTSFQVIIRDPNGRAGYERAEAIQRILKLTNVRVGAVFVSWMIPENLPIQFPRGDGDEIETSFDVRVGFTQA